VHAPLPHTISPATVPPHRTPRTVDGSGALQTELGKVQRPAAAKAAMPPGKQRGQLALQVGQQEARHRRAHRQRLGGPRLLRRVQLRRRQPRQRTVAQATGRDGASLTVRAP
jgi:hypothetical protein